MRNRGRRWLHSFRAWLVQRVPALKSLGKRREFFLFLFFVCCFIVVFARIFYLQVVKASYYDGRLTSQHFSESELLAERGHIYVQDKSNKPIQLTENITLYTVFVDPELIADKKNFIELMTPVVYAHLCVINGFTTPDQYQCVENVQNFTRTSLLPSPPSIFYYGSGTYSTGSQDVLIQEYETQVGSVLSEYDQEQLYALISQRLDDRIQKGYREYNPL